MHNIIHAGIGLLQHLLRNSKQKKLFGFNDIMLTATKKDETVFSVYSHFLETGHCHTSYNKPMLNQIAI